MLVRGSSLTALTLSDTSLLGFAEARWPQHQVSLLICYEQQQDDRRLNQHG